MEENTAEKNMKCCHLESWPEPLSHSGAMWGILYARLLSATSSDMSNTCTGSFHWYHILFCQVYFIYFIIVCIKWFKCFVLVIFSVYSLLLFGDLCHPNEKEDDSKETFYWFKEINCTKASDTGKKYWRKDIQDIENGTTWKIVESTTDHDFTLQYSIVQFTWVVLVLFTCIFCIREVVECLSLQGKFFKSFDSYRHIIIDILLILCLLKGYPVASFKLQRWQYHVATFTGFLLWLQMMIVAGKYPGYGKYIYMFR